MQSINDKSAPNFREERLDSAQKQSFMQEEIDILYFPPDIKQFSQTTTAMHKSSKQKEEESKFKKTFFPYREMVNDDGFQKVSQKLGGPFNTIKSKETLKKKLSWNDTMRKTHTKTIRDLSKKTYDELLASSRKWNEVTKMRPMVIKRYTPLTQVQSCPAAARRRVRRGRRLRRNRVRPHRRREQRGGQEQENLHAQTGDSRG